SLRRRHGRRPGLLHPSRPPRQGAHPPVPDGRPLLGRPRRQRARLRRARLRRAAAARSQRPPAVPRPLRRTVHRPHHGNRTGGPGAAAPDGGMTTPAGFDDLIHPPTRLGLVALLAAAEWVEFSFLKESLGLTDSALSKQISTL